MPIIMKKFEISNYPETYPIYHTWNDFDEEQKEACYERGYNEDHSPFWFMDGMAFSLEGDIHPLQGVFECFGDYPYYLTYWDTTYLAKFNGVCGYIISITLAQIEEIQE